MRWLSAIVGFGLSLLILFDCDDAGKAIKKRHSPVEGLLVLLDFATWQFVELGVNVYELVLLLHLFTLFELVVDPLPSVEQVAEFGVCWHDSRFSITDLNLGNKSLRILVIARIKFLSKLIENLKRDWIKPDKNCKIRWTG